MSVKVFIPEERALAWASMDKIDLAGEIMTFRKSRIALRVVAAYFFDHLAAGSDERLHLLGKAKTKAAVSALGAEISVSSAIIGDAAYDVQAGFIGKPLDGGCTVEALVAAIAEAGLAA